MLPGGRAASGTCLGGLRILAWDETSKALALEVELPHGHTAFVTAIIAVSGGATLLSASEDSTLRLWARGGGGAWEEAAVLRGHTAVVDNLAVVWPLAPA